MYTRYQFSITCSTRIFISLKVICIGLFTISVCIPGYHCHSTLSVEYDSTSMTPLTTHTQNISRHNYNCSNGWTNIQGICYRLIWHRGLAGYFHFLEAAEECLVAGGFVGSLPTQHIENRVLGLIRKEIAEYPDVRLRKIYIGLNDLNREGNFSWFDGSRSYYHNWGVDEPNNQLHEEDCVSIYSEDQEWHADTTTSWSDYPCCRPSNTMAVLCQTEPNTQGMEKSINNHTKELIRSLEMKCYGHQKNECDSSPCYHGGRCIDDVKSFKCMCTKGFYGELCQFQVQCPAPQYYPNTLRSYSKNHRMYYYGAEVTYMCNEGFVFQNTTDVIGTVIIRCNESGEWYPQEEIAPCEAILCKPFPIWRGYKILKNYDQEDDVRLKRKQYSYGLAVNYTCKEGFQLANSNTYEITRCNIVGNWTPPIVNCSEAPIQDDPEAAEALRKFKTPVEATAAEAVGSVGLIFMLVELGLLIIIDFDTLSLHMFIFFSNIVGFCFRGNYTTKRPSGSKRISNRQSTSSVKASRGPYTYDSVPKETEYQAETVL